MVHGAGIQVVVIRVFKVVSQPAWNVATATKCKRLWTCEQTFLYKLTNFSVQASGVHGLVKVAVIWCWQLSYHSLL